MPDARASPNPSRSRNPPRDGLGSLHSVRRSESTARPCEVRGRLLPGSSYGRSVDVDDRRTVTSTDYDEPALIVARVALSMNGALRHVQEVAGAGLDHSASPWSRLHPQGAVDHINRCVVVGVMVPACGHVRFSAYQSCPHTLNQDRLLSSHAWSTLPFDPIRRPH